MQLMMVPPVTPMVRVPGDGDVTVPRRSDWGRFRQEELYLGGGAARATDSENDVGDVPGDGEADDAGGEGVVGDDAVFALGVGGVGDAPGVGVVGDANAEGVPCDAPGVGAAGDAGGEGAAGDAMVDRVSADALMVRVLQGMLRLTVPLVMTTARVLKVMVLGVGPRMGGRRRFWVWALATPCIGPGKPW